MHTCRALLLAAAIAAISIAAQAQDIYVYYPHIDLVEKVPAESLKRVPEITEKIATKSVTWNVTYDDVVARNGRGFDGPNGAQARAVIAALLQDIGAVLNNTGSADIEFKASQTDGSGYLAISGCYFYFPGTSGGFSGGFVHDHIINGTDPSLAAPFDGDSIVDFGFNFFFGYPAACPSGQLDFYSVMLHELTHTLGFLTLTSSSGASTIGNNRRSLNDRYMQTGNGKDLFADAGAGAFLGTASDLVGGGGGLVLAIPEAVSAYGSAPALYSPNSFVSGSSLSHLDYSVPGVVMHPALSVGAMKRGYSIVERAILGGLGYNVSAQPTPTPSPSPSPTPICLGEVYREDFEAGLGEWFFSGNQQGLWHVTAACKSALAGHSGARSFAYAQDVDCDYDNGGTHFGYAYSPTIDLTGVAPPITLSFKYFLETEGDQVFDLARFDVSSDNFLNYTSPAANQGGGLSDPSGAWLDFAADISAYAGQKLRIRLLFATGDNQANYFSGWYLDDVAICASGAAPTASPSPSPSLTPSPTYTPTPSAIPNNMAGVYSHNLPAQLRLNQQSQLQIIMRNDGLATWTSAGGYALAVADDPCGLFASLPFPRLYLDPQASVPPGQIAFFNATIQAPAQAGSCLATLRMVQEQVEFFGETVSAPIQIVTPPPLDSAPGAHSIPKSLTPGQSAPFAITIRNTGSTAWSAASGFALAVTSDNCHLIDDADGIFPLPADAVIPPEGEYTFNGTVSLLFLSGPPPQTSAAGDCKIEFRMVQLPSLLFGASVARQIDVTNAVGEWAGYD